LVKVSIVVPTYREAENIPVLVQEINRALKTISQPYEIVIVDDDSDDGIEAKVDELGDRFPIRLKVRKGKKGLASAVLAGIAEASGEILVVMDADLSHPPGKLPALVGPILRNQAEFVIASRFMPGGSVPHFSSYRKLNALVSRWLARPLTRVSDPMSGFFAFHRRILRPGIDLNPLGFKIGLEILVKAGPDRVMEEPIEFQPRLFGESKLSLREQLLYLRHLKRLFGYRFQKGFGKTVPQSERDPL